MKNQSLLFFALVCGGCGSQSPYDVSPAQAQARKVQGDPGTSGARQPLGSVGHDKVFKKGEVLPDGTIAKGNVRIVTEDIRK